MERPWLTYAKALIFILPAILAWSLACAKLVPRVKEICAQAGYTAAYVGWIWPAAFFLADWGPSLLVAALMALVLVELVAGRRWPRRLVIGIGIWLANVGVLLALVMLLVIVILAVPELVHPR